MKYIFAVLLFFITLTSYGQRIDAMPPASSANGLEIFHVYQSSDSRRMQVNQVKAFVWDLSPTINTSDTIGFLLVRRASDGKIFKRHVSSLFPGYKTVEDEGTPVTQSSTINFTGAGVSVAHTGGKTTVTIPGGGVGGGGSAVNNVLDVNTTTVGNITTGEDVLYSFTVDKDSVDDNEDVLTVRWSGTLAGNGNTKTIKAYLGDDPIVNFSGTFTSTWTVQCEIVFIDENSQKSSCTIVGASSGITHSSVVADLDQDLSSDVVIQLTGEATSTNDIVKETATIFRNTGGGGGSGVGGLNTADFVAREIPSGTINGINTIFTIDNTPTYLHVYVNGLLQDEGPSNDYTISGTTLTMVVAPPTDSKLLVSYIK